MKFEAGFVGPKRANVVWPQAPTMRPLEAIDVNRAIEFVAVAVQPPASGASHFNETMPHIAVGILRGIPANSAIQKAE